jgi:uncharacterized protein YbjT (DUF2867 family)
MLPAMTVAVVGGTGALGKLVVAELRARGDEVLALSRRAPRELPEGASHRGVDLTTGEGLEDALAGAEVVVDASNESPRGAGPVLVGGTKRLLRAGAAAGVRHHVGISIVGCDRVPMAYYKVKVAQEQAIAANEVPWSLLRATQFHTLLAWGFAQAARWRVLPTGRARLQPIDPAVVAERVVAAARAEPAGRLPDVAGPEVRSLGELSRAWQAADGRRLLPLRVPTVGKTGRPIGEAALCNPDAAGGGPTFEQWLVRG